jgi:hypothetical protein
MIVKTKMLIGSPILLANIEECLRAFCANFAGAHLSGVPVPSHAPVAGIGQNNYLYRQPIFLLIIQPFQMARAKNIRVEFPMRCLLLVVGMALFAAPLSHKFYLFASRQSFRGGDQGRAVIHRGAIDTDLGGQQQCRLLSLDKRYDFKQIFGASFPDLICLSSPVCEIAELFIPDDPTFIRKLSSSFLRGPPGLTPCRVVC